MNKLQKIVEEMEEQVSKVKTIRDRSNPEGKTYFACHAAILALETHIPKLQLLLKEETAKDLLCKCDTIPERFVCQEHCKNAGGH